MARKPTKLTPVADIPDFAVVIRCCHERGAAQQEALSELGRRSLWLSEEQKRMAFGEIAP